MAKKPKIIKNNFSPHPDDPFGWQLTEFVPDEDDFPDTAENPIDEHGFNRDLFCEEICIFLSQFDEKKKPLFVAKKVAEFIIQSLQTDNKNSWIPFYAPSPYWLFLEYKAYFALITNHVLFSFVVSDIENKKSIPQKKIEWYARHSINESLKSTSIIDFFDGEGIEIFLENRDLYPEIKPTFSSERMQRNIFSDNNDGDYYLIVSRKNFIKAADIAWGKTKRKLKDPHKYEDELEKKYPFDEKFDIHNLLR